MSDIDIIGSFNAEPMITGQLETTLVIQGNVDSQFPAQVSVDSVTTGDPGTDASVVNAGTPGNARLQFTIPRGNPGATGPANSLSIGTVEDGASADATITGGAPNQTLNLTLPKGDPGDAATITVGTVTTVSNGSPATVENVGTDAAAVFNFEIPEGAPGVVQSLVAGSNITIDATDPANPVINSTASGSGDLLSTNNLSDLADAATARTNLGLGTAATTAASAYATSAQGSKADSALQSSDVGTTAGKIVALDGSGKLPAVDGSQLTGISSGSGDVLGPATNSDAFIPQWNGANSKTLKNGLAVGSAANNIPQLDSLGHLLNAVMGASSIGATGYYTLPGGLIVQWGRVSISTNVTVTFPVAFPNACTFAIGTYARAGAPSGLNGVMTYDPSASSVSFTMRSGTGAAASGDIFWLAIGY